MSLSSPHKTSSLVDETMIDFYMHNLISCNLNGCLWYVELNRFIQSKILKGIIFYQIIRVQYQSCWSFLPLDYFLPWHINELNTLRPRQNGCHFADDIFKGIFLNENISIPIKISLKFVPKGPVNNIPALVQIMAWRRPGDKPLSEPMMVCSPTHICVTRPQWVNFKWKETRTCYN